MCIERWKFCGYVVLDFGHVSLLSLNSGARDRAAACIDELFSFLQDHLNLQASEQANQRPSLLVHPTFIFFKGQSCAMLLLPFLYRKTSFLILLLYRNIHKFFTDCTIGRLI
jgi:hypothetical protein